MACVLSQLAGLSSFPEYRNRPPQAVDYTDEFGESWKTLTKDHLTTVVGKLIGDAAHEHPPCCGTYSARLVSDHPPSIQPDGKSSSLIQRPQCTSEQVGYLRDVRLRKRVRERE